MIRPSGGWTPAPGLGLLKMPVNKRQHVVVRLIARRFRVGNELQWVLVPPEDAVPIKVPGHVLAVVPGQLLRRELIAVLDVLGPDHGWSSHVGVGVDFHPDPALLRYPARISNPRTVTGAAA